MAWIPYILSGIISFIITKKMNRKTPAFSRQLHYALVMMMLANLSFPSMIQYVIRVISILYGGLVLLFYYSHNISGPRRKAISKGNNLRVLECIFAAYSILCITSTLWSVNPIETIVKSVEIIIDFILIYTIITRAGDQGVAEISFSICSVSLVLLIASLLGMFIAPSQYLKVSAGMFGFQLKPFLFGTDAIAALAVVLSIFMLNYPVLRRKWLLYGLSLIVVFLAQARTSIAILGIVFVLNMMFNKVKPYYVVLVIVACVLLYLNFDKFLIYFNRGAYQVNIDNLNGRRTIWRIADELIKQRPFLGYGFGAGGNVASSQVLNLDNTHNAYYEIAMGLGYTGVLFVAIQALFVILTMARKIVKHGIVEYSFEIMFIAFFVVRSYTSTGIGSWSSLEYITWLFLMTIVARKEQNRGFKHQIINAINIGER